MTLNEKNLYIILELDPHSTCSQDQIKQAYRKMASKYHPDKYTGPIQDKQLINDKFIDIKNAYDILSDVDKKQSYDMLEVSQQSEFYDVLKAFIKSKISDDIDIDQYIKLFFDDDEDLLKKYINNLDFFGIYQQIVSRVTNIDIQDNININITGTIYATYSEKYNNKYRKLQIKRKTRDDIIIFVPLNNNIYILEDEGEYVDNNKVMGDIILNIETSDSLPDNYYIDKNNLYVTEYISLYDYLYGGDVVLDIFSNKINVKFDSFIEKFPSIIIKNKGFIINETERGDICIMFKIKSLEELKHNIKNII